MKGKKLLTCLTLTLFFYLNSSENSPIDLDEKISDFILEERQIFVPGYPDAFNPSIIRWENGRLLMSFRTRDPKTRIANLTGFIWLDNDFNPVGKATLLKIENDIPLKVSKAQGARLVKFNNVFLIVYNNILDTEDQESRRVIVAHLHFNKNEFSIRDPKYILSFENDPTHWREKNWSPFQYKGRLYFSYSLNPHRVFHLPRSANAYETVAITEKEIDWEFGEMRGGSPAIQDGNRFLGFFHSWKDLKSVQSNSEKIAHYFMGAYLFQAGSPFEVTHVSKEPIIGKTFYHSKEYETWKPLKVIYPGGMILNENFVWVVYGKQDHECWIVKMDKKKLLDTLVPL
ncbi:MAG: hypothetical protein FJZ59_02920 [Chlamydiae bacterium]|jgi:predicted GH43/DUF377 family glycosyl hydrolase|nr:hypothetical protein [Chlamydiota bacterium]